MSTATTHVYSVRLPDGRTFGPVPGNLLVQWAREGRIAHDTRIISSSGKEAPAAAIPELQPYVGAHVAPPHPSAGDETLATIIPYRNRPALIGYYLSIAGLLPILGAPCAPIALILGIKGYSLSRRDRSTKGGVHAWVAIILGLIGTLINILLITALVFAVTS